MKLFIFNASLRNYRYGLSLLIFLHHIFVVIYLRFFEIHKCQVKQLVYDK